MNATGTERTRAIIAAFRMKPEASQAEIALAAGVTQPRVSIVIQDYLESKAHERACLAPVRTTPRPAQTMDVANFARDGRFGGNAGPAACAAKEGAIRVALAENPRGDGEGKMKYCRRIAGIAGVSPSYVQHTLEIMRCDQIGAEQRAKDAEELKTKLVPIEDDIPGEVPPFKNWMTVFYRFKMVAEAYLLHAQNKGSDACVKSYLTLIRDDSDRAQSRVAMSKTN